MGSRDRYRARCPTSNMVCPAGRFSLSRGTRARCRSLDTASACVPPRRRHTPTETPGLAESRRARHRSPMSRCRSSSPAPSPTRGLCACRGDPGPPPTPSIAIHRHLAVRARATRDGRLWPSITPWRTSSASAARHSQPEPAHAESSARLQWIARRPTGQTSGNTRKTGS